MIVITGTGRSGTATLAKLLGGYHEYRAAYILEKYFLNVDPHIDHFSTIEKRVNVIMDLHQGIDPLIFTDSSNLYIYFIDALFIIYPSIKFVLSVRNGRDFVRSAASRGWHDRGVFGMVPQKGDPYFNLWDKMDALQRNAWIWTFRNKRALEGLAGVPEEQKLILRIEDIGQGETIDKIEAFTGRTAVSRRIAEIKFNANPSFDFPKKDEWTETMNEKFLAIAGGTMEFFGYE